MLGSFDITLAQDLIRTFLNELKDELIAYMDANNRNATGRSKASLQVVNVTQKTGQLIGSDSIEFVFRGRGPGKMPPLFSIIEWCAAKGIPRSMAWIIAKRIAEAGTELHRSGRNILKETITEDRIKKFSDQLADIYSTRIKTDIESLFSKAV